jgi:two-component system, chemotaxis family, sensor kinase CheA
MTLMDETTKCIGNRIEAIALSLVTLDGEDIPTLGQMLNQLAEIKNQGRSLGSDSFSALAHALEKNLERVVLRETSDMAPFEMGLEHLQRCFHSLCKGVEPAGDLSPILNRLGTPPGTDGGPAEGQVSEPGSSAGPAQSHSGEAEAAPQNETAPSSEDLEHFEAPDPDPDDEDREIISGFVMESLDGLETVEISLMEMEENPDDAESINAIFRSFHTIKGVSAFLGFMRINKLAHRSENLLDKIRSGTLAIRPRIVDVILDSVDLLKQLLQGVKTGLESGTQMDLGLAIAPLVGRIEAIQEADRECLPIGEIMMQQGTLSKEDLNQALDRQESIPDKKLGEILVASGKATTRQVASALHEQNKCLSQRTDLQVKVDTKKLDNLVDLTGELVIAQSMLRQHPHIMAAHDQSLAHTLGQLSQITSTLQTMTMSLRMVPIKSTFQKMVRLVRDLARNSGKQVRLKMTGEDTEVDRNVVDALYEPMVHMIRNSVDHGLEPPPERISAGKDPGGEITLSAYHRAGNIVVEISDDGRGLNKDRIVEKAMANNLITDETRMPDDEIYNLIFHPGFSTAKEVSEISGRGVGMDVVKKVIEKLRGRVEIQTRPGQGSTFVISLPLTLAIIEGMLVRIGMDRYVIPALSIIESFRPEQGQCSRVAGRGEMILTRGRLIPLVRLDRYFDCRFDVHEPWEGLVVTVEYDGKYLCLLLDELLGKEEVVIKSMGEYIKNIRGIAGGAIMGDGRVGLILDMAGIWQLANGSR